MLPDPAIDAAIDVGTKIVTNIFESATKGISSRVKAWNKERDFFGIAARKYAKKLFERYDEVKVLGMSKPVSLRSLYVRVNILEKISARQSLSVEALEELFDRDTRSFGTKKETVEGEVVVNKLQRFIVLGKPGAGKSTFLKYLTLQSINKDSKIKENRLPIFISLHEFSKAGQSLLDFIIKQFDICDFPEAEPFLERILENGKCIVLLDGLDEVGQEYQDYVIQEIINFSDKYSDNQYVMSCRVAAYNHWFQRFTDVEMADFNEAQIQQFINNWFKAESKLAEECWKKLKDSPQLTELATIPLLLTLLCITYDERLDFPPNRAELYEEAIEALLKKWDTSRRIQRDDVYKHLSLNRKKQLFSTIAAKTFSDGQYFIPKRILVQQIQEFLQNLPNIKEENIEPDSEAILQAIEAHHGIIVTRARGIYSFSHLTFQEYFTAKYIVENNRTDSLIDNRYDAKWKEVFLLTNTMLPNAESFLNQLFKENGGLLKKDEQIIQLVISIGEAIQKKSDVPDNLRKIYSLYIILSFNHARAYFLDRSYAYALWDALKKCLDLANTLDSHDFVRDLAHAFKNASDLADFLTGIDNVNLPVDTNLLHFDLDNARAHARDLARAFALSFTLDFDLLEKLSTVFEDLSINQIELMAKYLEGNLLMINCLQTDCIISKAVRQQLLEGILSVSE